MAYPVATLCGLAWPTPTPPPRLPVTFAALQPRMIAPSPRDSSRRLRGVRPRTPPPRHAPRPPWRRRAGPSRLPSAAAAALIALHALAYPAAEAGVRLLAPAVEARERNRQALVAVSQLVSSMFYGDDGDLLAWQRSLEAVSHGDLGEAVRSQARTQAMADRLLAPLGDPYSGYASQSKLAQPVSPRSFGLRLARARAAPASSAEEASAAMVVSSVSPGSAAELAGLRIGDEVDGISAKCADCGGVAAGDVSLSGDVDPDVLGQELTLRVRSPGASLRTVVLFSQQAQPLLVTSVLHPTDMKHPATRPVTSRTPRLSHRRADDVGYLRVGAFSEATTSQLVHALRTPEMQRCAGYVIDLRNNPGGQIREAMIDASMILGRRDAVVAYTLDAAGGQITEHTVGSILDATADALPALPAPPAWASDTATPSSTVEFEEVTLRSDGGFSPTRRKPIIILVDRGTASSAELFAAALHDNGAGLLVGEPTYGKALIQRVFPLPNGAALKLTIGEYFRPTREKIVRGAGIQPDVGCVAAPTLGADDACIEQAARLMLRHASPL